MISTEVKFPGYKQQKPALGNWSKKKGCVVRLSKYSPDLWSPSLGKRSREAGYQGSQDSQIQNWIRQNKGVGCLELPLVPLSPGQSIVT